MRQVVVVVLLGIIKWMALFVQKATSQPSAQSESACSEAFSFSNLFECEPCFQTLVRLSLSVSLSRFRSLPLSILSLNFLGREMRCLVSEIQIQRSESDAGRERETGRAARTTTITSALASAGR